MTVRQQRKRCLLIVLLAAFWIAPGNVMGVMVNKPAPDFTLPSTTGESISLSQFRGEKMVLIEFYAINYGST